MSGYQYRGRPHVLGIHKELFEKTEARVSGQRPEDVDDAPGDEEAPQRRGPLSIAEVFGLKPT